ncbi:MAG: bifunctional aldolase/short-chain dehydrogenase, partial [Myxococcales bacterium]|nr:bifunctional aldolase/short-chain dehydrogenase [Myxococcales bacterium]
NTSVKSTWTDRLGDTLDALFVKGSGWDLASIEPQGFSPVDLAYVRRLRALPALSDEDMVDAQRTHLLRGDAPAPSIETLLHAFLPAAVVDHSHADAIVALTNRPDGEARVRDALGSDVIVVPYVKAGFDLAKVAAELHDAHPDAEGMVLLWHGLFTWGATARESYQRHLELVTRAERALEGRRSRAVRSAPEERGGVERILPALRGALGSRFVLRYRPLPEACLPGLAERAARGPLTPDHVLRTKPRPLVVDADPDAPDLRDRLDAAVASFVADYEAYFEACAAGGTYVELDPAPRVVWLAGYGVVGVGATAKAADAAADIAEHTLRTIDAGDVLGPVTPLPDERLFEMEYWSLEQRKLGKTVEPVLARRVALITGGAGAIGVGVARRLLAAGAHVVLTDRDPEALDRALAVLADPRALGVLADVTDTVSVDAAFDAAARAFGGVDLVVVNAGIAVSGRIEELDDAEVARATEVNLHGALRTIRAAARQLRSQRGLGGDVVLISTKNVAAPGASFGAYSATKAGAHQLARVAALELAPLGVRVNLVAPDAVFAEGEVRSGLWEAIGPGRAAARGLTTEDLPAFYRSRNLLGAEVTGSHVGEAVVFLASGRTPTTGAVLPVDGGLPDAFPR